MIVYHYILFINEKRKEMCGISQATQGKLYLTGAFGLAGTSVVMGYVAFPKAWYVHNHGDQHGDRTRRSAPVLLQTRDYKPYVSLSRRQWLLLLAQAFLGIFLFRMFLLLGVRHTSTSEAGILTGAIPAMTAIGAYAMYSKNARQQ